MHRAQRLTPARPVALSIPVQQAGNARDGAGKLPSVIAINALHDAAALRLVLEIDEREPLSGRIRHDVGLAALLDLPGRRVSAAHCGGVEQNKNNVNFARNFP